MLLLLHASSTYNYGAVDQLPQGLLFCICFSVSLFLCCCTEQPGIIKFSEFLAQICRFLVDKITLKIIMEFHGNLESIAAEPLAFDGFWKMFLIVITTIFFGLCLLTYK